ncbi:30S ribosomal protein S4 [Rhodobacterales bacterium HTCC2255]|nr:30S ribosomal protein S4 [Rhodobacterales bacterium HTCC2255]
MALGFFGMQKDKASDIAAIPEATIKTNAGEYSQI